MYSQIGKRMQDIRNAYAELDCRNEHGASPAQMLPAVSTLAIKVMLLQDTLAKLAAIDSRQKKG